MLDKREQLELFLSLWTPALLFWIFLLCCEQNSSNKALHKTQLQKVLPQWQCRQCAVVESGSPWETESLALIYKATTLSFFTALHGMPLQCDNVIWITRGFLSLTILLVQLFPSEWSGEGGIRDFRRGMGIGINRCNCRCYHSGSNYPFKITFLLDYNLDSCSITGCHHSLTAHQ